MSIAHALERGTAFLALLLMGLMAGFFFAFAIDVVPAFAELDAGPYVQVQQHINRVVRSAGFGAVYFGAALAGFLAALAALAVGRRRLALGWLLVACVWFVAVFWLTRSINVPINDALALWNAAAPPAEWQAARDRWNEANRWRAWASGLCFCAALALALWRPAERPTPAA
ncbi:MAG: DUF1772 domain-containing protein [Burkholderiales bacterium]|nr:DUF1772 domain-containing protein [Burkholderiales bacterium]